MKIVFFGTSNVALPVLEALNRHHTVLGVVTSPDAKVGRKQEVKESPVSVLSTEMKLKILKPQTVKNNNLLRLELQDMNADVFVVVSYGKILPKEIIDMPRLKTVNVHFSKLPKYRGSSPIQTALLNGEVETAISVFILDEKMDEGPILGQKSFPIDSDDNFFTLSQKMAQASGAYVLEVLKAYEEGKVQAQNQDHSQATYTKLISRQDGQIDWSKTSTEIYNQFRALYPWPGVWTLWNGKQIKITDCMPVQSEGLSQNASEQVDVGINGQVMVGGVVLCGKNTFLQIKTLQLEGKKEMAIADFLNGYPDLVSSKLGLVTTT